MACPPGILEEIEKEMDDLVHHDSSQEEMICSSQVCPVQQKRASFLLILLHAHLGIEEEEENRDLERDIEAEKLVMDVEPVNW